MKKTFKLWTQISTIAISILLAGTEYYFIKRSSTIFSFSQCWARQILRGAVPAMLLLAVSFSASAQVNVTTNRYNNQRTAVNSNETILTPANVNPTHFGKLFTQSVDGMVFAQPLYVANVTINGAVHNVIYVVTEHDSVYAFDADSNTGANALPLWHTSFLSSSATTVPSANLSCIDIQPEYGITGTPVIDLSTNTLYVVSETLENGSQYLKRLHALDITTGAEKPGSGIEISASVTVPGQSPYLFDAEWQGQRPGLLLYNGVVYIGFGSHCDNYDYRGWILGYSYNGSSFSQAFVFSDEPSSVNGRQGGIWMAGEGLAMDTGSNLFVATGNGEFDTTVTPPVNYGDSILRLDLSQGPTVRDYFSPSDTSTLDAQDLDLGSGGVTILPDQPGPNPHLLVQAGKQGNIFVVNRDNMGHFSSSSNNIVQELDGAIGGVWGSPVYFNGKVYYGSAGDYLKAFSVTNGLLSTSPSDESSDSRFGYPGTVPTISANGTSNAILWALNTSNWSETHTGGSEILYAYDPTNLAAGNLYNSWDNASRDDVGPAIKFAIPTVANGKVYVGTEVGLTVYGELGSPTVTSLSVTSGPVGTAVTITGTNFGSAQGSSTVTFNGTGAAVTSWSATSIATSVPNGAMTGNVVVKVGGVASNGVNFTVTVLAPLLGISPTSITFPSQYVGTRGIPQNITLANPGTAALNITNVSVSPSDFGVQSTCGSSLASGANCSIGLSFDPSVGGARTGTLTITDNAAESPQTVTLSGVGQDFSIAATTPSSVTVTAGQTASYTLAVAPVGGFNQTVALSCSGAASLSVCNVSPSAVSLNGTSSTPVTVTIATTAPTKGILTPFRIGPWSTKYEPLGLLGLAVGLIAVISLLWCPQQRLPRFYAIAMTVALALTILMSSCSSVPSSATGGGSLGTPAGTYTISISASFTSGSVALKHSTSLTLIVQ